MSSDPFSLLRVPRQTNSLKLLHQLALRIRQACYRLNIWLLTKIKNGDIDIQTPHLTLGRRYVVDNPLSFKMTKWTHAHAAPCTACKILWVTAFHWICSSIDALIFWEQSGGRWTWYFSNISLKVGVTICHAPRDWTPNWTWQVTTWLDS